MEPVVIASISGPLPILDCAPDERPTLWQCLAHLPELRDRTIVLLDVEDLRRYEELGIGSGLSWERTAQETITELRRSKTKLRRFLAFATVIVRFGSTGALQITRQKRGWSYRLYFDPNRDDKQYTDSDERNHVLGYSSVFSASLVEELIRTCNVRAEKPLLHDTPVAIGQAIPRALIRCQLLFENGYGDPSDPRSAVENTFDHLFPRNDADNMPVISQIEVPELRMPDWSILSQTAQGNMGQMAKDIVVWGVDAALNRHVPPSERLIRVLAEECGNSFDSIFVAAADFPDGPVPDELKAKILEEVNRARRATLDRCVRLPPRLHENCLRPIPRTLDLNLSEGASDEPWKQIYDCILSETEEIVALGEEITESQRYDMGDSIKSQVRRSGAAPCIDSEFLDSAFHETFAAPVLRYGKEFTVVDRMEIEGIRAVHKLIKDYLEEIARDPTVKHQPLPIAVFGPPGSGKSTAVKSIVKELTKKDKTKQEDKTKQLSFNLAQYTSSDNLKSAFDQIVQANAENKVAVAFFDEFDSRYGNEQWGWLKFFLAPMEDKVFREMPVHNSIFVFAGGTSPTYEQFALVGRQTTDPQVQEFAKAKGPDFVSRLSGYLNVVGVNPSSPRDELYLIRRAIVIRHFLSQNQKLEGNKRAQIDDDMLRAILFVPNYINNTRSVRKMLEQCSRNREGRVAKSSVPLLQQLAMLTDGKAFMDLLADVSSEKHS
jgi:ATPase family associated with various cellular activities (AAA)